MKDTTISVPKKMAAAEATSAIFSLWMYFDMNGVSRS